MMFAAYVRTMIHRISRAVDNVIMRDGVFERTRWTLPFVYYLLFFAAFLQLESLSGIVEHGMNGFAPRWPLFWTTFVAEHTAVTFIFVAWTLTALLAAVFPQSRIARIVAFLGLFQYHAYMASFGTPNHQWDHWLWVLFILIWLPSVKSNEARRTFPLVFWGAQAFLLLTYSMAGIGKLLYGFLAAWGGQSSIFHPDAAALHVAQTLFLLDETAPLANAIVAHPTLGWLALLAAIYIQFFALSIAFRPELHRAWGVLLILFHIGTLLTMRAVFVVPSALILAVLLSSPFAPERLTWRQMFRALPLVRSFTALSERLRR